MGKFKRIPMKDIKTMQKILDDLPDKNLGKTREEAAELLNAHILKALEKGYKVRKLLYTSLTSLNNRFKVRSSV